MRRLNADEIECRVAQVNSNGCSLLLYKTARVDRAILDEEFGQFGWQNDFKVIDGKMYGGIGIYSNDLSEWLWRWDCGTESNTEAEKGQASDCFKRAGFKWGIGVELYTAPFIWVNIATKKNDKGKYELEDKYIKFAVKEIGYSDKGEIIKLKIADDKGNIVYEMGKKITQKEKEPKIDPDTDLLEGLKACSSYSELSAYYKRNFPNVKDTVTFNTIATKLKAKFKEQENVKNNN